MTHREEMLCVSVLRDVEHSTLETFFCAVLIAHLPGQGRHPEKHLLIGCEFVEAMGDNFQCHLRFSRERHAAPASTPPTPFDNSSGFGSLTHMNVGEFAAAFLTATADTKWPTKITLRTLLYRRRLLDQFICEGRDPSRAEISITGGGDVIVDHPACPGVAEGNGSRPGCPPSDSECDFIRDSADVGEET